MLIQAFMRPLCSEIQKAGKQKRTELSKTSEMVVEQ